MVVSIAIPFNGDSIQTLIFYPLPSNSLIKFLNSINLDYNIVIIFFFKCPLISGSVHVPQSFYQSLSTRSIRLMSTIDNITDRLEPKSGAKTLLAK